MLLNVHTIGNQKITQVSWYWWGKGKIQIQILIETSKIISNTNSNIEETKAEDPFCHLMESNSEIIKGQTTIDQEDHLLSDFHPLVTRSKGFWWST